MSTNPEDAAGAAPFDGGTPTTDSAPAKPASVVSTSLAVVKTTVKAFDAAEAGLAKLTKRYENVVFDVSTTKGMKEATDARLAIRAPRYAVKKALDDAKRPLNDLKADITARAASLTERILALETPIDEQIKAEEKRKLEEKAAREEADRKRILAISERITAIRMTAGRAAECRTSTRVGEILAALEAADLTGLDEFEADGKAAHAVAVESVKKIHQAKLDDEAERARREREQAEEAQRLADANAALAAAQKKLDDERAAFQAQQDAQREADEKAAAARQQFEAAAAEHEAKPLPADASPAQTTLHGLAETLVATGRDLLQDDVREQPAQLVEAQGHAVDTAATLDDVDSVSAGFDAVIKGTHTWAQPTPVTGEITEQELVDVAIEAVASFFDITEQQAALRLAAIRQWNYEGHALAA